MILAPRWPLSRTRSVRGAEYRIVPVGNLGNQMFQYMVALKVQGAVPSLRISGYDLPDWGLSALLEQPSAVHPPVLVEGKILARGLLEFLLRTERMPSVLVPALPLRMQHLLDRKTYGEVFEPPIATQVVEYDSDCIVVNIRAAEILGDVHPDYAPVPLSFINTVLERTSAHPVFVGQIGNDPYSRSIRERWPDATFRPSEGALADFETLRRSTNLVVSVSTFSWLAAWLSRAQSIHMPVAGLFNPAQRPDVDLLPVDDERYTFYEFPVRRWNGNATDLSWLTEERNHPILDRRHLKSLLRTARHRQRRSVIKKNLDLAQAGSKYRRGIQGPKS
jgi:hypothetical protein